MDTPTLAAKIRERLNEIDASASYVSRLAVGEQGAIGRIYQGHSPSFERACKIFDALGLEFYFGPPLADRNLKETPDYSDFAAALGLPPETPVDELVAAVAALSERARTLAAQRGTRAAVRKTLDDLRGELVELREALARAGVGNDLQSE